MEFYAIRDNEELKHYGIKNMQWGVRNYQYEDGRLTPAGKARYRDKTVKEKIASAFGVGKDRPLQYSKKFGIDKKSMDGAGRYVGDTMRRKIITGDMDFMFPSASGYATSSDKTAPDRPIDLWYTEQNYFSKLNRVMTGNDGLNSGKALSDILDENHHIKDGFVSDYENFLRNDAHNAIGSNRWSGSEKPLTEDQISSAVKECEKAAKLWNSMVDDIDRDGLTPDFFENNENLSYPMMDGTYCDANDYLKSIGAYDSEIDNDSIYDNKLGDAYVKKNTYTKKQKEAMDASRNYGKSKEAHDRKAMVHSDTGEHIFVVTKIK